VLAAGLAACGASAAPADTGGGDAFLCYGAAPARAPRGAPAYPAFAPLAGVTLIDRFGSDHPDDQDAVDLRSVQALCAPAVLGARGAGAPAVHLEAYRLRQSRTRPRQPRFAPRVHTVAGGFGELSVKVSAPDALLVPSALALGPGGAPALDAHAVDHFQCYRARATTAPPGQRVALADAFGERLYDLGRPTRLCLPADKNGEDPAAPAHAGELLCYQTRLARTEPRQPRSEPALVSTLNQLGAEVLRLGPPREVCLPATAVPDPPAPSTTTSPAPTPSATPTPAATATLVPSPGPTVAGDTLLRISLRPPEIARLPTEVKHFWATGHYADGTTRDLTTEVVWASSNPDVATAPNDPADPNRMDLHVPGTALISATHPATGVATGATGDDAVLRVTGPLSQILVYPPIGRAFPDGYEQFTAVGYYSTGTGGSGLVPRNLTQDVEWSVTHPDVASADNPAGDRSRIVARAPGITSVYATDPATGVTSPYCGDLTGFCSEPRLMVLGDLESITLDPTGPPRPFYNLRIGHTARFAAIGRYEGGGFKHITQECTFAAATPGIFDTPNLPGDRGLVEAVGGGTTTLTATHDATGVVSAAFEHYVYGTVLGILPPEAWLLRPRAYPLFPVYPFRWLRALYANGTGPLLDWEVTVDDPTVATATGRGVFPLRLGVVSVGARDPESGVESDFRLTITFFGDLQRVLLSPEAVALRAGGEDQLTALTEQEGGHMINVTQQSHYTSSDPAVVEATNDFSSFPFHASRIVAHAPGEAVISASYAGLSSSASGDDTLVTVVGDLTALTVTPPQALTAAGRSVQLTATGEDAAGRAINLTQASEWSTTDAGVAAAANPAGDRSRIDGVAPGSVTVRATDPVTGLGGDATLTVLGPIGSLLLLPETLPLLPGASFYLTTLGIAADGTLNLTQDVVYASDAPAVVAVTNDPEERSRIVALAPGTARVTATDPLTGMVSTETVVTVTAPC